LGSLAEAHVIGEYPNAMFHEPLDAEFLKWAQRRLHVRVENKRCDELLN
jgi:hypothetical protein